VAHSSNSYHQKNERCENLHSYRQLTRMQGPDNCRRALPYPVWPSLVQLITLQCITTLRQIWQSRLVTVSKLCEYTKPEYLIAKKIFFSIFEKLIIQLCGRRFEYRFVIYIDSVAATGPYNLTGAQYRIYPELCLQI
jgi:hypothetical protein